MENSFDPLWFWKKVTKNPNYAFVLPITLALHRFERDYQSYTRPRIFLKELDEQGFALSARLNHPYIKEHKRAFNGLFKDLEKNGERMLNETLEWMSDENLGLKIAFTTNWDRQEYDLYEMFSEADENINKNVHLMPPILIREDYDEKGIAGRCRLNEAGGYRGGTFSPQFLRGLN